MNSTLLGALSAVFLAAALALPGATSALDAATAEATIGGECWGPTPSFVCQQVTICDTYNNTIVIECPAMWCFFCSNGNRQVWNCIQDAAGGECDRQPNGTDCGELIAGTCNGQGVCVTSFGVGECDDGPNCDGDCP